MKIFIVILILAAFFQSSFLPINLVLILLICRSLVFSENINLILALSFGALLGFLNSINLGFYSLIFLVLIEITQLIKRTPLSSRSLVVIPFSFVLLLCLSLSEKLILNQSINYILLLIESFLSLPIYLLVRIWEERFEVKKAYTLKV